MSEEQKGRKKFQDVTGMSDADITAFEAKVQNALESTADHIQAGHGDTADIYSFIKDEFKGKELVLLASQMLGLVIQGPFRPDPLELLLAGMLSDQDCGPDCDCDCDDEDVIVGIGGEGGLA